MTHKEMVLQVIKEDESLIYPVKYISKRTGLTKSQVCMATHRLDTEEKIDVFRFRGDRRLAFYGAALKKKRKK